MTDDQLKQSPRILEQIRALHKTVYRFSGKTCLTDFWEDIDSLSFDLLKYKKMFIALDTESQPPFITSILDKNGEAPDLRGQSISNFKEFQDFNTSDHRCVLTKAEKINFSPVSEDMDQTSLNQLSRWVNEDPDSPCYLVSIRTQKNHYGWMFFQMAEDHVDSPSEQSILTLFGGQVAVSYQSLSAFEELRNAQEQLVQSGKMTALGEMAGGIAHEINNPVAIIHAAGEILELLGKEDMLESSMVLKTAGEIKTTAMRISKIVKGLRLISRDATKDTFSHLNLYDVLEDSISLCRQRLKVAGVVLKLEHEPIVAPIQARPSQLAQMFLNLFANAVDAMADQEEKEIRVKLTVEGDRASVSFEDNGCGLPEAHMKRIFDPFFTTKEPGKGTGLGLSTSRKIVETHRGQITAENTDSGARFTVSFPIHHKEKKNAA